MRSDRLFCKNLEPGELELSADESHHALHVLRLKKGESVVLFDGAGREAQGVIAGIGRRHLWVEVESVAQKPFELPLKLTLAVAMPKGPRQGFLIEKCTELGAASIWPILTEHGVVRPGRGLIEKWSRRAIEAAKQSRRAWVPMIAEPRTFAESLRDAREFDALCLAHPGADHKSFADFLREASFLRGQGEPRRSGRADSRISITSPASVAPPGPKLVSRDGASLLAFIGPEGGWTDEELALGVQAGARAVTLGPTILRTETAAIAVCAAAAALVA